MLNGGQKSLPTLPRCPPKQIGDAKLWAVTQNVGFFGPLAVFVGQLNF
jgi:hypothetical protein